MPYIVFPNQVARLDKLTQMLAFVEDSIATGENIADDAVLGYGLARSGLYRFRGLPAAPEASALEARIALERAKEESTQGALTAARHLRRMFLLFGLIRRNVPAWTVTDRGKRILAAQRGDASPDVGATEWIAALLNLKFRAATDDPGVHAAERARPLRVMLEMLDTTTQPARNLALAFGASDETAGALSQIRGIVNSLATGVLDWPGALATVGAGTTIAANNVKIIPSMAEQLGLISRTPITSMTETGRAALARMRASQPIWAAQLDEQVAPSALLVALQVEEMTEQDAAALIAPTDETLDEALALIGGAGVSVDRVDGRLKLGSEVSFDAYQDVPDSVYTDPVYQAALGRVSNYVSLALTELQPATPTLPTKWRRVARTRPFVSVTEEEEAILPDQTPAFTYEDLLARRQAANVARERRTQGHARLVGLVAEYYRTQYAVEPRVSMLYDLYLLLSRLFVAHEMKTITPQDERDRIREAVGQLFYYQYFELPGIVGDDAEVLNIVAVDNPLTDQRHMDFLSQLGVGLIWADRSRLYFEGAARAMLGRLPPA